MFVLANFIRAVAGALDFVATFFMWLVIIRALLSWVSPDPYNPIVRFIERATEPLLAPFRKIIPAYKTGIDFSPIFAALFLQFFVKVFVVSSLFGLAAQLR